MIAAFATISVVSGLKLGIKILSITGFSLGCFILFVSFVMEKSYFLLNLLVQTTGTYLQWCLLQVPFWTAAFDGLKDGEGRAVDDKSAPAAWMVSTECSQPLLFMLTFPALIVPPCRDGGRFSTWDGGWPGHVSLGCSLRELARTDRSGVSSLGSS